MSRSLPTWPTLMLVLVVYPACAWPPMAQGATNLLTGVASAYVNHAPMIVITGAPMISQMLRGSFQELDQLTLFRPVTKAQIQIQRGDRVPELIRHAFRIALAGKKGPVLVDLPRDMLNETAEMAFIPPERYRWAQRDAGDATLVQQAAEILSQATTPVVIAGGGVIWSEAQTEVLAVAEQLNAAVVTSYGRNDAVPHDHPLVIGGILEGLPQKPRDEARLSAIQQLRQQRQQRMATASASDTLPLKPQRVYRELREVLPHNTIVTIDAGAAASHAYNQLDFYEPRTFITPGDLGCVGAGFPSALGAKLARPDRPVVCLCGDGGFLMTSQDLETAVRERIPVVTVVMTNNCWGSEKAYQKYFFNERYVGSDFGNPRFDEYARLFGAQGLRVEKPEELRSALEKALTAAVPTVLEIPVDPDELPFPARSDAVRKKD
jgi:thiamine pyrophosphate-dependent acetolactate synthase large subunit-like protein